MPPRKTTDFGALFESLIEDLRIQVAASVDRTLSDFSKRLARIERRLDQLDPANTPVDAATARRICALCDRTAVARGLCSAHYQQWRYRERKTRVSRHDRATDSLDMALGHDLEHEIGPEVVDQVGSTVILPGAIPESRDN